MTEDDPTFDLNAKKKKKKKKTPFDLDAAMDGGAGGEGEDERVSCTGRKKIIVNLSFLHHGLEIENNFHNKLTPVSC